MAGRAAAQGHLVLDVVNASAGGALLVNQSKPGFEVLVPGAPGAPPTWRSAPIVGSAARSVRIGGVPPSATKVRYNWYSNPCGTGCFGCAVYVAVKPIGTASGERAALPLPPFIADL